ncbi:MAG TPA: type I phosphomannose isomerase catalytic subunit [Bacteroidales bacterium]|nr:type I phosphomannose isomerase catalytic subunit [Bacteroidales bacterium]
MNELYPLKFKPVLKDKIWGGDKLKTVLHKEGASSTCGESWEISTLEGSESVVDGGFLDGNSLSELIEVYMGDLVGDHVYDKFGIEFPLLIKYIDARERLSIQVHPDDETAMERHRSFGKTEMWYVIDAEKEAGLITGFNRTIDRETYLDYFNSGRIEEILNVEKVTKGDCFFIPAGRVHTIGAGILLAEIQQTSDQTYRIFDWNRTDDQGNTRELHTELAVDVIDFEHRSDYRTDYEKSENKTVTMVDSHYFTTSIIQMDSTVKKDFTLIDSFIIYMCPEGRVNIRYGDSGSTELKTGETILIPAQMKSLQIEPLEESTLLEIYLR